MDLVIGDAEEVAEWIEAGETGGGDLFVATSSALAFRIGLHFTLDWAGLEAQAPANVWGDEIYFGLSVQANLSDDAVEEVEVGDLAYWPPGNAFCIFFGPTPVSRGDRPRAASPVNVFGRLLGDATAFRAVSDGTEVTISALAE